MFTLTSAAAQQIQQAANASDAMHLALRVAARPEADGSIQYGMGFDDPAETDLKLEVEGVAIVIAADHQDILDDTTLDYVELQPGEFNFIFIEGRQAEQTTTGGCAPSACGIGGCGSSKGGCH